MNWPMAALLIAMLAAPASAAVVKASMGVSVTVVASCRVMPGQPQGCAPAKPATAIPAPQPVVSYSRDPKTGATVETVEF